MEVTMSASVSRMFNPSFLRSLLLTSVSFFTPDASFISYLSFSIFPLFCDCRDTHYPIPTGVFVCLNV